CAFEPAMSCMARRRSKSIEALMRCITAAGPALKRPPHRALAPPAPAAVLSVMSCMARRMSGIVASMPRKKRVLLLAVPALLLLAAAAWLVAGLAGGSRPAAPTAGPEAAIVLHQFEPTGRPAPEAAFTDAEGRELTL